MKIVKTKELRRNHNEILVPACPRVVYGTVAMGNKNRGKEGGR